MDANATDYVVRKSGNDRNNRLSASSAFRTIRKADNVAKAGDTVYVGTGTYNGRTEPRNDGTAANPIRFVADTSGAKSGDAGAVILIRSEAFRDDSFKIDRDDFIQIIGFTFYGNTEMISWKDCVGAYEYMSANGSFRVLDWTEKR
jgi:hypothetical protein